MSIRLNVPAIKKLMAKKGMTGKKLAEIMGVCRQNISTILRRGTCSIKSAGLIASALCVEIEEIWMEEG